MAKSQSSSRSSVAGQKMSKASNAIRRAITNSRSAVKRQSLPMAPGKGGAAEE